MLKSIEWEKARDLLLTLPAEAMEETITAGEALDRVLAEDTYAAFPVPPFDKSPFDGYAFRGGETLEASPDAPAKFHISGEIAAGDPADTFLGPGTAVRIFTGAPIPPGADAVIKFEQTQADGETVNIPQVVKPGQNVVRTGEDYTAGTLLAGRGTLLTPAYLGVLASQGVSRVSVYKKPVVSVISTGSELVQAGSPRPGFAIYNSSYPTIAGYLRRMGFIVRPSLVVRDDADLIRELTEHEMHNADLVITTGGASVGDYDYAVETAQALGAGILFWKVRMKPGGAILAAEKEGKLLLSLSGNPAAAIMGMSIVAQPWLRRLCGLKEFLPETVRLPLKEPLPKKSPCLRLLRGHLEIADGKAFFAENSGRGNGNLSSFENCDLIGFVPAGSGELPAGTMIKAYRLPRQVC